MENLRDQCDRIQRYKRRLRSEKRVNEELAKRINHWKKKCASQSQEIKELKNRINTLSKLSKKSICTCHLRLRPTPNIDDSFDASIPSSLSSTSDSETNEADVIMYSPQQCQSPKINSNRKEDNEESHFINSLRSSNASHLICSLWRTSTSSLNDSIGTRTNIRSTKAAASAVFVAGPSYSDVTQNNQMNATTENIFCHPTILDTLGKICVEDDKNGLPKLVENICFPNNVALIERNNNKENVHSLSPISIFSLSVVPLDGDGCGDGDGEPTTLYGIFATIDPSGKLAIVEHDQTGKLIQIPFVVCILTYESTELRHLSKVLRNVVQIEEDRMRTRLQTLRCGGGGGYNGSKNGAIHLAGDNYGKLCKSSIHLLESILETTTIISETSSSSTINLLPLFEWGGSHLFLTLSIERCMVLLGCALTEQKIIFVSKNTSRLGASVLAFVSLLSPLTWCGPLIPILPNCLEHILEAPFPLIAGVTHLDKNALKQRQNDAVIVNLDKGKLLLPTSVTCNYIEFKLPHCEQISHELTDLYSGTKGPHGIGKTQQHHQHHETLLQMTQIVREAILNILHSISHDITDGTTQQENINPFLVKAKLTQMFSYWKQKHPEEYDEKAEK
jgi:hypothetical protein